MGVLMMSSNKLTLRDVFSLIGEILGPERGFYTLALIYGVGISILSLATPISVQMLINTVANTGLTMPLIVLSATLFGLLLVSGLLNALRIHLMEIFGRRFYARFVSEIALRSVDAQNPFFIDEGRGALFNRYFDIVTIQKIMPTLLIGGFTIILQAGVGFVLVSFYHPFFLIFNIIIILLIWMIWGIWGRRAVRSAIDLSHKKHAAAAWLQGLGGSNGFFKSERHIASALSQTDAATALYVDQHKRHFRLKFAQTISFLVLYAAASAALLGFGGWFVIQGQLTLGQLVAAELILSAAFFGLSQLGVYLNYFYDLCASVEELSLFLSVQQETPSGRRRPSLENSALQFNQVRGEARSERAILDFKIESGAAIMAVASDHGLQRLMTTILKRHVEPEGGYVTIGGCEIRDLDALALRQEIFLLDRSTIIETTIRDYLQLSCENAPSDTILNALKLVGLEPIISQLPEGLDTKIAATGWPLSVVETLQLKLAAALVAKPRLLIMNQLFDLVPENYLITTLNALRRDPHITVIYFSNRRTDLGFDAFLYLRAQRQDLFQSFSAFEKAALRKDIETDVRVLSPRSELMVVDKGETCERI